MKPGNWQKQMEEKYGGSGYACQLRTAQKEDIKAILEEILHEFPVTEIDFTIPKWRKFSRVNTGLRAG